jgi:hypothetical protein
MPTIYYPCCDQRMTVDSFLEICSLARASIPTKTRFRYPGSAMDEIVEPMRTNSTFYMPFRRLACHGRRLIKAYKQNGIDGAIEASYHLRNLVPHLRAVAFFSYFAFRVAFWDQDFFKEEDEDVGEEKDRLDLQRHPARCRYIAELIVNGLNEVRNGEQSAYFDVPVDEKLSKNGDEVYEYMLQTLIIHQAVNRSSGPGFFETGSLTSSRSVNENGYYTTLDYLNKHTRKTDGIMDVPDRAQVIRCMRRMTWLYWRWRLQGRKLLDRHKDDLADTQSYRLENDFYGYQWSFKK